MEKMIKTKYGYATPQEAKIDARLDKWYKDKKCRAKQHGAFSLQSKDDKIKRRCGDMR